MRNKWNAILIFAILSIVWGSSFILIKYGLKGLTPFQLACARIVIAALFFTPFFLRHFKKSDIKDLGYYALVGLAGSGIPAFLYAFGQTQVSSSIAGILNSLTPIFTLIIGVLFFKMAFKWSRVIGVLVGFAGVSLLFIWDAFHTPTNLFYVFLIVLGTVCYGTSVNTVKRFFNETPPIKVSAISFFLIGPPALIALCFSGFFPAIANDPNALTSLMYITILAVTSTFFATILFYHLVQITHPVFSSSVAYLIPIVAMMWGFADGEPILWIHFVALVCILIGVWITKK